ncbi:MAG: potassium transporter [Proteobacteria bacterium]|nr:potassium transporter [Pseudomonadota bacterium]
MQISICFHIFGYLMLLFSSMIALSGVVGVIYNDSSHNLFFFIALFLGALSVGIINTTRPEKGLHLNNKQGFLITVLTWIGLSLVGSLPLYFAIEDATFIDSWFESVSGITTTGATVFNGLENLDKSVQFWRMFLQWIGGMGILVLAVAVLPFLGVGGMKLYRSELPGVTKDKLQPRIAETAKILWELYLFLTVAIACVYFIFGMTPFDAITHSFTTIATGGFSNYDASFKFFDNPSLEWVTIFIMIICGMNFSLHYLFITRRINLKDYLKNEETKFYLWVFIIASVLIYFMRISSFEVINDSLYHIRQVLFHVISLITTTGFVVSDYEAWHGVSSMVIFLLMFMGGCSGSTSGGVKSLRIMVALKQGKRELNKLITTGLISYIKINGKNVDLEIIKSVLGFMGLFVFTFCAICIALSACGVEFETAISAAAATITNTGPGLADVGPSSNMSGLPDSAKTVLIASMILGRLEIFTVLVIFLPTFWKK